MSERIIPKAGVYKGQLNGSMSIYEADSGSLCIAIPAKLIDAEVAWSGKATITLINADGVAMVDNANRLRNIWDGWTTPDPYDLLELEGKEEVIFECDCKQEEYTPKNQDGSPKETTLVLKIAWINPVGGGSRIPLCADRKTMLAKYGSKFKAAFGGTTTKPAAKSQPVKEKAPEPEKPASTKSSGPPKKSSGPPPQKSRGAGGTNVTCTMDEAWQRLQELRPDDNDDALSKVWYTKLGELFPDVEPTTLTITQWGQMKVALEEDHA